MPFRTLTMKDLKLCSHLILVPEHYGPNGVCRCGDESHKEMLDWGYQWNVYSRRWEAPAWEHDCTSCTFLGTYKLRHPRWEREWREPGDPSLCDVYLSCDPAGWGSKYIVRTGEDGDYATTDRPGHHVLGAFIDGEET